MAGVTPSQIDLPANCAQLIAVQAATLSEVNAVILLWDRDTISDTWSQFGQSIKVVVGKKGMATADASPDHKKEGDLKAPSGLFSLGTAFGYEEKLTGVGWPYMQITSNHFAIDDPVSAFYNRIINKNDIPTSDWNSAEKMLREDGLYKYGLVINYNTDNPVRGNGSCIFMHIWRGEGRGTEGCSAMAEKDILTILRWLDPAKQPCIWQGTKS
ncbi:MAG: L,D-transpeptidase family protein [Bacteroidota bacterium]|nr:L,D-transpeptidase family protein [Bacteroidota bacterium]